MQQADHIAITGPIGSGKSALIKSLLNESNLLQGKFIINGMVSLAS